MTVNYVALVALAAASTPVDPNLVELATFPGLDDAFKEATDRRSKEAKEAAVGTIMVLLDNHQTAKTDRVRRIRELRELIDTEKGLLDHIDRALAYGKATSNYVPWAASLGVTYRQLGLTYGEFEKLSKIPASWTPPTTPAPTTA